MLWDSFLVSSRRSREHADESGLPYMYALHNGFASDGDRSEAMSTASTRMSLQGFPYMLLVLYRLRLPGFGHDRLMLKDQRSQGVKYPTASARLYHLKWDVL